MTSLVLSPTSANAVEPTEYYVDRTVAACSDAGPGTSDTPFCTIATGVTHLAPGRTLYIGDGTYPETVLPPSGTSESPVVVSAWPDRQPVVGAGMARGVYITGKSDITISGLTIRGTTAPGIDVDTASRITIRTNTVTDAGSQASGFTAPGIRLRGVTGALVEKNQTLSNSDSGIFLTGSSTNVTVSHNTSAFNAQGWQRNANGINVISPGNLIIGNVTHDNEDSGIQFFTGGNNNVAMLNVTYNNGDHGIDDLNVTGGVLIGNTVVNNCTTGINVEGTSGSYTVKNNIAVDNGMYPAYNGIACNRRRGNIGIWDSAPPTTVVDHNLVYLRSSGTMYAFAGTSYSSLAAMKAATGQEASGVQANPKFADQGGWNLTILPGSAAIDRGASDAPGELATDILGAARIDDPGMPNTFASGPRRYDDLGAFESQTPTPAMAPDARLTVTPASGAAPLNVTADASASFDANGDALTYSFDFGDGTAPVTGADPTVAHLYAAAGTFSVTVTVTDSTGLSSTATAAATARAAYVNQIATNSSSSVKTSGSLGVWRPGGVRAGDLVLLTLRLNGTQAPGGVAATDTAGSAYTVVSDVAGPTGTRLVVLRAVAAAALPPGAVITATFPQSQGYGLTGDEFVGVTTASANSTATGTASTFASGPVGSADTQLVVGAVALSGASAAPTWASGWTSLGTLGSAPAYLSRAYRITTGAGPFEATGTASGSWSAGAVIFRP